MTGGRLLGMVLLSFMFPGFGQGLAFRRTRMLVWAVGDVAATFAIIWSVWFFPLALLLHVAAPIDAFFVLRQHVGPTNRNLAAISVVIAAVGLGYVQLALHSFKIPSSSMYPTLEIGDNVYVDKLSLRWRGPERGEIVVLMQPCAHTPYIKRVIATGGDTVEVRCNVVYVNGQAIANELVTASETYRDYDEMSGRWIERPTSRYRETHGRHTYFVFHDPERPERDKHRDMLTNADTRDFPQRDRMFAPSCQQSEFYAPRPDAVKQPTGTLVVTKPQAGPCEQQAHFVVPQGTVFVMGDNRNNANDSRYWGVVGTSEVIGRAIGIWLSSPPGGAPRKWGRIGAVE